MPICKKCTSYFPYYAKVEGKVRNLGNRKYCLRCSPFGVHNTLKLHTVQAHTSLTSVCSICTKEYTYDRNKGHRRDRCNSCSVVESRRKLKVKCVEYKGGKCVCCGYSKHISALEFHHLDPTMKDFSISKSNISFERLKKELDKCVLVCANCHREVEAGITSLLAN